MVYGVNCASGKIRWEREVHRGTPEMSRHLKNSYASETPVTDGERVYAYFSNVGLFVFDMDGKPLWSKDFGRRAMRYGWGTAASPILHRNRLYIVNDNDTESFLAAFDAADPRCEDGKGDLRPATPRARHVWLHPPHRGRTTGRSLPPARTATRS